MLFNNFTFHSTMLHNEKCSKVKLSGNWQKENANIFHPLLFCKCEGLILQLRAPDTANNNCRCGKYKGNVAITMFSSSSHISGLSIVLLFSFMVTQTSPKSQIKEKRNVSASFPSFSQVLFKQVDGNRGDSGSSMHLFFCNCWRSPHTVIQHIHSCSLDSNHHRNNKTSTLHVL